jgi:hypothetical protein
VKTWNAILEIGFRLCLLSNVPSGSAVEFRTGDISLHSLCMGTWWRSWLRHCATGHKVAGSIPDGVTGIFH